jgi:hypothetical protein
MLYDDFQNENSHYNCKDSVFKQNDIIIFRQNDIKTRKDKGKTGEQENKRQNDRKEKNNDIEKLLCQALPQLTVTDRREVKGGE